MTVSVLSAALAGIDAVLITVETRICAGVSYFIVGLPGEAVKESLFRVESALTSGGFEMPRQKILISLAPAGIRKEGAVFDLPIALSVLAASGQLAPEQMNDFLFTGELSLTGKLRPIKGTLSVAVEARKAGIKHLIVPKENANEAAMVSDLAVFGFESLSEVVNFLHQPDSVKPTVVRQNDARKAEQLYQADFSEVRGQEKVKRALEVMAAGGHNGLLIGPPGTGKTMLATRLPGILPPLGLQESLETTRIYSVAGQLDSTGLITERPFRSVHHTASDIALVGGGPVAMPGEISLAHNGVLFMDELPEFKRRVLEVLRQPLEERQIAISRASYVVNFPANFVLLAAMNSCPCGFHGHPDRKCSCTLQAIRLYRAKLSGPLLDRIDLHIGVPPADLKEQPAESSAAIRRRVVAARNRQLERAGVCNALMSNEALRRYCILGKSEQEVLNQAMVQHQFSARSYERILKMARTVADLAGSASITLPHLAEAIGFRSLESGAR
ncbi:YifB family Mg chelatase-like AAA ATPase [Mucilaginibacter sp. AK015]|uniref:YifB family Mg chelatase-like AAA ATPase n=1 Tax=Mucilaginibacter sp. AK015 TaxID=2723072 RepID=UPI001614DE3D|nr:YifB family Mg chelatase-like AAA ATPase [Mucilaginibacter sp. AK015]MBB5395139.1 magnesium chelatase family protein [Mucilaginibacter sp. AK015]